MAATKKKSARDRSRAWRLRQRGDLSPPDRAWLQAYEGRVNAQRAHANFDPIARKTNAAPTAAELPQKSAGTGPRTGAGAIPRDQDLVPIFVDEEEGAGVGDERDDTYNSEDDDADDDAEGDDEAPSGPRCTIEDCTACDGEREKINASQICGVTGKRVWPPLGDRGAKGIASALLFAIGQAIRLFRPDRRFIPPNKHEREELAADIREVARRRAGWMGAIDDIVAVLYDLVLGYPARAISEPDRPQLPRHASADGPPPHA